MRPRKLLTLPAAVVLSLGLIACGGSEAPTGNAQENAFLESMVPHHVSAVEMAKVARTEARTPFVKNLAEDITSSQSAEVEQMKRIHERLFNVPLEPNMGGHMQLGLSAKEAGMDHMDGAAMIRGKRPFDRAFVDEMIPHHQGATRMAAAVLGKTRDPELRTLAEEIISAQRREISAMTQFREREYGT